MTEDDVLSEAQRIVREQLKHTLGQAAELPKTVSPVVGGEYSAECEYDRHHYPRPCPPSETIERWDDGAECWIYVRTRTQEEMAEARERYLAAIQEYERTGGTIYTPRPVVEWFAFKCADGSTGRAVRAGDEWRITEASGPGAFPIGGKW